MAWKLLNSVPYSRLLRTVRTFSSIKILRAYLKRTQHFSLSFWMSGHSGRMTTCFTLKDKLSNKVCEVNTKYLFNPLNRNTNQTNSVGPKNQCFLINLSNPEISFKKGGKTAKKPLLLIVITTKESTRSQAFCVQDSIVLQTKVSVASVDILR